MRKPALGARHARRLWLAVASIIACLALGSCSDSTSDHQPDAPPPTTVQRQDMRFPNGTILSRTSVTTVGTATG